MTDTRDPKGGEISVKVSFDGQDGQDGHGPAAPARRPVLRILVLADLGTSEPASPTLLREAADLQRLLEDLAPRLVLDLPNLIAEQPPTLECRLHLRSFREMAPEALVREVPGLAQALELRRALERVEAGAPLSILRAALEGVPAGALGPVVALCRQALAEEAPPTPPASTREPSSAPADDAVGRIMDLVDLPSAEERAAAAVGKVVGAVGARKRPRGAAEQSGALGAALGQLGELVDRQTRALLEHPELQRVEAAWRGLKLLTDRTDFRRGIEIAVMHLRRPAVDDAVVEALLADPDVDLALAPWLLSSAGDATLVQWLAGLAERHQVPLVISLGHGFFGVASGEAAAMGYPGTLFEQQQYTKWNAVRRKGPARWVAAVFNRVLLREGATELLGDPCWVVGALASRSHARVGWPTEMAGRRSAEVGDLPIHELRDERGRKVRVPLESLLSRDRVEDLARCGVIALAARDDSDAVFLPYTPTLYQPSGSEAAVSLPYQLLASRVARAVAEWVAEPGGGPAELEERIRGMVGDTGPDAAVEVVPRGREVQLRLRTGAAVLGGVALELAFRLPD
jgi:hypothetical protein